MGAIGSQTSVVNSMQTAFWIVAAPTTLRSPFEHASGARVDARIDRLGACFRSVSASVQLRRLRRSTAMLAVAYTTSATASDGSVPPSQPTYVVSARYVAIPQPQAIRASGLTPPRGHSRPPV